ncbi:MAG: HDOD domain-containing protein [Rhodocyclaceae bacterium]|nr:HDOD domain-containing protein [Rhodocyclaceae bacterium]
MHPYQWQWGINQWVEYLKDKETPVLPRTRAILEAIEAGGEAARDALSARDLTNIVYGDPYLALKLLRRAEERRSRQLGHDTTTPLAAVLQTGYDELRAIVADSPVMQEILPGCEICEFRSVLAAAIARSWARRRADVSPDELAMSALLVDTGELLLWHFAPEMTTKETKVRDWNERYSALTQRPSVMDFSLRQLSMVLAQAWALPNLIVMLIKGTDTPRANIPRLAADAAKLITNDPEPSALLAVLREVQPVVPGASLSELLEPLPLPEDILAKLRELLELLEAEPPV